MRRAQAAAALLLALLAACGEREETASKGPPLRDLDIVLIVIDTLRTDHLPQLEVPCLFVHGTRDPFGAPEELEAATATIPGPVTHEWIDGGRHDLKGADSRVAATVAEWLASLR